MLRERKEVEFFMVISIFSQAPVIRRQVVDFLHAQALRKLPHALVGVGDAFAVPIILHGAHKAADRLSGERRGFVDTSLSCRAVA